MGLSNLWLVLESRLLLRSLFISFPVFRPLSLLISWSLSISLSPSLVHESIDRFVYAQEVEEVTSGQTPVTFS